MGLVWWPVWVRVYVVSRIRRLISVSDVRWAAVNPARRCSHVVSENAPSRLDEVVTGDSTSRVSNSTRAKSRPAAATKVMSLCSSA